MRRCVWLVGLLIIVLTGLINIGVIAMDDYFDVVSKIIPAQHVSFSEVISSRGIHSPLPALILLAFSKTAFRLGISQPINQLRFVLVLLGIFSFVTHSFLGSRVFRESKEKLLIFFFLVGFHFTAPLFFTRAMVETLSAPFISLAVLFLWSYCRKSQLIDLTMSALFALIAFQIRYQTFAIVPGILLVLFLKHRKKEAAFYVLLLSLGLVCGGFLEQRLTGEFFGIARPYFEYNLHFSSGHGVTPFYTFLLLFMGIGLFPFFISRYQNFEWNQYREIFPVLLPFASFFVLHSMIPHKEERFMVPVLNLFFILLTPLAAHQFRIRWRFYGFALVNCLLLVGASFSVPQRNSILMIDYLARDKKYSRVIGVKDTLVLYPEAYGIRKLAKIELQDVDLDKIQITCTDVVAVRQHYADKLSASLNELDKLIEFKPGFLEATLVKLNPKQNARRDSILLYRKKGCG